MFSRLSRARVPFRRYIQTQSVHPASHTAKYAIAVGTLAAGAFLGTRRLHADSDNTPAHKEAPKFNGSTPPDIKTYLRQQIEEESNPALPRPLASRSEKARQELPPAPVQKPAQTTDEAAEESDGHGEAAFNPETGEINWDCPCLGGMAHGPCGPEFREAFSCFVYSEDEPKGINCVEKFQGMQSCFREHPDIYASELTEDDDDPVAEAERALKEDSSSVPTVDAETVSASTPKPSEDSSSSEQ
ncbi:CHCH domain protein [Mycena sanguinolenta]|uniref:Mitochondrial intermembrane space import and assembly protein 40 n=1 Tax=Mycena sanguinolenta TaxID=230812 RepID=A0A8H7DI32_9AGAR|nr:CHCH domain protein [Mycena sanguinolenta]